MKLHSFFRKTFLLIIVLSLLLPAHVTAATPETVQPTASYYLSAYSAYICPLAQYDIQIWWNVIGTGGMADIGALTIMLYESTDKVSWTWVKTYTHNVYTQMLDHNTGQGINYVFYDGDHQCYYKAYVSIYAGNGTNGDTRYFWTPVVQGTP